MQQLLMLKVIILINVITDWVSSFCSGLIEIFNTFVFAFDEFYLSHNYLSVGEFCTYAFISSALITATIILYYKVFFTLVKFAFEILCKFIDKVFDNLKNKFKKSEVEDNE